MLVFLIIVLNSKHLHIFVAPLNVLFKRQPVALGAMLPMMNDGKPLDFENLDDLDEDAAMGIGKIEDFAWKGLLDMATCTECGRCQSQCPAWNTEKPLSPKLLIMELRDHAFAKAPYILAGSDEEREALPDHVKAEAERQLVGATEGDPSTPSGGAVIDPDVLWSCVSCGACVQQCPVDIEHVDHIMDMRRYQVLVESNFPSELNGLFKGLENKGNPWNMSPNARMDWAKGLDFEVKQVGVEVEDLDEVDWLFWVGCAGAYEDRAKKTTRAVAELLDMAGVSFAVLGDGETCTGDPARRAGNEFVFQQLAMQNAEVFKETKVKKVVSTCAHCFNTLKNEYAAFGVELEVVHHTQLLNRLVREGKLTPVAAADGPKKSITYHDPCYLGRHNQVYSPPRELLQVIPNAELTEMPRNSERSFCCGAGGAQMWMEEKIGERINVNRTTEAVGTGADQIAVGCPFCRVMLSDGLTAMQSDGSAREEVEVLDVAQLLLASVKRADTPAPAGSGAGTAGGGRRRGHGDRRTGQAGDRHRHRGRGGQRRRRRDWRDGGARRPGRGDRALGRGRRRAGLGVRGRHHRRDRRGRVDRARRGRGRPDRARGGHRRAGRDPGGDPGRGQGRRQAVLTSQLDRQVHTADAPGPRGRGRRCVILPVQVRQPNGVGVLMRRTGRPGCTGPMTTQTGTGDRCDDPTPAKHRASGRPRRRPRPGRDAHLAGAGVLPGRRLVLLRPGPRRRARGEAPRAELRPGGGGGRRGNDHDRRPGGRGAGARRRRGLRAGVAGRLRPDLRRRHRGRPR